MNVYSEAIARFLELLQAAMQTDLAEPKAMTLATVGSEGRPGVRTVLLKQVDERGFTFFTNTKSRKGRDLTANPRAALCFHWQPLKQQVIVEGSVERVSDTEADEYWRTRPRDSQFAAWASNQSEPLDSLADLRARHAEYKRQFEGQSVARPPHWSGYRVVPDRIEFWTAGWARLHERVCYQKTGEAWSVTRLNP